MLREPFAGIGKPEPLSISWRERGRGGSPRSTVWSTLCAATASILQNYEIIAESDAASVAAADSRRREHCRGCTRASARGVGGQSPPYNVSSSPVQSI